ncbi:hypothetical protein FCV25MIE_16324, partial [Fagus crenata]
QRRIGLDLVPKSGHGLTGSTAGQTDSSRVANRVGSWVGLPIFQDEASKGDVIANEGMACVSTCLHALARRTKHWRIRQRVVEHEGID